jgi:serine/threonine protein kinase
VSISRFKFIDRRYDVLVLPSKYLILDILGQGTFGQVVKCQNMKTHEIVAVKVVKNKPAYFSQSMMEVTILELVRGFELNKINDFADDYLPAKRYMGSTRRTSYPSVARHVHSSETSLPGVRAPFVELVRAHQAESILRLEHPACSSVYSSTA